MKSPRQRKNKVKLVNFRVTDTLFKQLRILDLNISQICREALEQAVLDTIVENSEGINSKTGRKLER